MSGIQVFTALLNMLVSLASFRVLLFCCEVTEKESHQKPTADKDAGCHVKRAFPLPSACGPVEGAPDQATWLLPGGMLHCELPSGPTQIAQKEPQSPGDNCARQMRTKPLAAGNSRGETLTISHKSHRTPCRSLCHCACAVVWTQPSRPHGR